MEKILKKYTTIPDHLYIERKADKQLERIVKDMERPGYVLVARQMGKTNLLFRAKRELENKDRLFIYVDLSNYFEEERECYRNIIDCIIEPNFELFESIEPEIENIRSKLFPPHKEYSRSLREILSILNGDLVIILDEIDALRSAVYSDHIFAQIRSTYFARTNFPDFNRITYILSGVIEPADLIKDRNKSPFNIGDKIYLDDFTYEEHSEFIKKSKLNIQQDVSAYIYDWTNGNPRLTFDICSEIEDFIQEYKSISTKEVDKLINEKYLKSFDIPPVDHIRELVSENEKIRKAVVQLRNGEKNIDAGIKQKLYLYGIISSDFDNPKIKNKIVDRTLSNEWISNVEKDQKSLFQIGLELMYEGKDLDAGIKILQEVLESEEKTTFETQVCNYWIGHAYHEKGDYKESNNYLNKSIISKELFEDLHYQQMVFRGLNNLFLNQFNEGEKLLMQVIEEYEDTFPYLNAILNLSIAYIKEDFEKYADKTESLLKKIVNSDPTVKSEEHERLTANEYKTIAYYYLFLIKYNATKIQDAKLYINNALEISNNSYKPELLFNKYRIDNDENVLDLLVDFIIENNLILQEHNSFGLVLSEKNVFSYLIQLEKLKKAESFEKLFNYVCGNLYHTPKKEWEVYSAIANATSDNEVAMSFYTKIVEKESEIEDLKFLYNSYRYLALGTVNNPVLFTNYFEKYLSIFKDEEFSISVKDISIFARAIKFESDGNKINNALQLGLLIEPRIKNLKGELEFESIIIYYWIANLYYSKNNEQESLSYTGKTLDLLEKFKDKKERGSIIDEKGLNLISEQMRQIKASFTLNRPITVGKKYGRNEIVKVKYKTGKVLKTKYKKVEADILAERCKIIVE